MTRKEIQNLIKGKEGKVLIGLFWLLAGLSKEWVNQP